MRLAGIYIVWDDWEILSHSIRCMNPYLDGIIVVASTLSTKGEFSQVHYGHILEPDPELTPRENETAKRNFGLDMARDAGYTHFLMMDADEIYEPFDKEQFDGNYVCNSRLYFKSPTLYLDDPTRVPFIHRITEDLFFKKNYEYPFSVLHEGRPAIDPTRTLNITEGVEMANVTMHHYSYIRRDIRKKIRNSAGEKVKQFPHLLLDDYQNAEPGYKTKFFNLPLKETINIFGLPEMEDLTLPVLQVNSSAGGL